MNLNDGIVAKLNDIFPPVFTYSYGPKGVGKSELISRVHVGTEAVIQLSITTANSREDYYFRC